ncbi:MAG: hypothetical protein ACI39R_00820, partial [Lachnospiraceae bacterium]
MARICKKCGEKLFPTDTFCGFCGATVEDMASDMEAFNYAPKSLVGDEALSKGERENIELAKRKYLFEAEATIPPENKAKTDKVNLSADAMLEKKEKILAAKREAEQKAKEEAARLEAEQKAKEEA